MNNSSQDKLKMVKMKELSIDIRFVDVTKFKII